MNALLKYMNNAGDARDGKHEAIDGWMWWAWNANSGDTGGIVSLSCLGGLDMLRLAPDPRNCVHLLLHVKFLSCP
jgi:hypothetical protein